MSLAHSRVERGRLRIIVPSEFPIIKKECLFGTFSCRARSLATTYIFARVCIIGIVIVLCVIGIPRNFLLQKAAAKPTSQHRFCSSQQLLFNSYCIITRYALPQLLTWQQPRILFLIGLERTLRLSDHPGYVEALGSYLYWTFLISPVPQG